jgi:hypothetical protein
MVANTMLVFSVIEKLIMYSIVESLSPGLFIEFIGLFGQSYAAATLLLILWDISSASYTR